MSILRLFDFLSQTQILEIANYLCRTPILTTKTIELTRADSPGPYDEEEEGDRLSPAHQITAAEELVMNFGEDERTESLSAAVSASRWAPHSLSAQKKVRILEDSEILRSDSEESDRDETGHESEGDRDRDRDGGEEEEERYLAELMDEWNEMGTPLYHVDPTQEGDSDEERGESPRYYGEENLFEDRETDSALEERADPPDYWQESSLDGRDGRPRREERLLSARRRSEEEEDEEEDPAAGSYVDDDPRESRYPLPRDCPSDSDSDSAPDLGCTDGMAVEEEEEEVSEHLCFIIHRGGRDEEAAAECGELTERWIEFSDPATGLPYYHNPDTG
jgi:hypothetical protein